MDQKLERRPISLIITDFDNTLYDWFAVWYASFSVMLDRLVRESGIPADILKSEIRQIHQRRGTSEYSYLLNEISVLRKLHPRQDIASIYRDAIVEYRKARKQNLVLYPGVSETLRKVRENGVPVVVYTESLAYHAADRIKRLDLDGIVSYLYSPPDHDFPQGIDPNMLRSMDAEHYRLKNTIHHHTPSGVLKPDSTVLNAILEEHRMEPEQALYVGDSLIKDVAMAQKVGVTDVYAKYGTATDRTGYDLLREISHWTDRDIERERRLTKDRIAEPSHVLSHGFSELLEYFDFGGR